ncbi:DUF4202 domain-containing protein [Maritimibacter sp. 55A14]|uniref:DUF4202 domain-containing protein n=1 Tax=Maritimibacter sp. 55A14 TaxID=2174844 RepID=UPI000D6163CD|nr:DUF4202 domain-containing protein [Maritimibacter sp. 55A14]PWE34334.1 DUF4202 domain-containing protein [Maritimibacter sp. 55A14]
MSARLRTVLEAIDAANAADPTLEPDGAGEAPAALLYGRRMSAELAGVATDPPEVLQIAVRGQHIERWKLPRTDFPEGRDGYLAWRRAQAAAHAGRVAGLMEDAGYDAEDQARAGQLLRKEGIKRDADVQMLEDVACLVFLRWYFADFAARHDRAAVARIAARTARKMSPEGRARAQAEFDLGDLAAAFAP